MTYILNDSCETRKNNFKQPLLKYLKDANINVIGYPRAESYDYLNKGHYNNFQKNVMKDLINMEDPNISQEIKDRVEVIVNFKEDNKGKDNGNDGKDGKDGKDGNDGNDGEPSNGKAYGEVSIKLKKEEKLAEERKKVFDEDYADKVLSKNIFILFIDSVSRVHFKRKLPKTYSWIEKYYKPEIKSKDSTETKQDNNNSNISNSEAFQFLKFHGVGTWTNVNMIPAMFGTSLYDRSKSTYYLKYFKDAGYMTGSAGTMCSRELIDLDNSMSYFNWASYDHELQSFFCDPNFTPDDNPYPILNGPYSIRKKCLYGKQTADHALDYAKQFFEAYKDYPKVFRIDIIDQHEGTGEVVRYDDDLIYNFLVDFEKNGHMKDTTVFILSDHNFTMPGPYSMFDLEDWKIETTLPFLSIILDKNMKRFAEIKENLVYNENIMVQPYDIHSTTLSLFDEDFSKTKKGQSLFLNKLSKDPKKRSCKQMDIKKDWCRCSGEY